jgi:hypothetical protein
MKKAVDNASALVIERICAEIISIRKALPALQYCSCVDFKDAYWCDLLQGRLNFLKNVKLDSIFCLHFYSA